MDISFTTIFVTQAQKQSKLIIFLKIKASSIHYRAMHDSIKKLFIKVFIIVY